jgi:hypothetical protein
MGSYISKEENIPFNNLFEMMDFIATNYILSANYQTLIKLTNKEHCDRLFETTSSILDENFSKEQIEQMSKRISNKGDLKKQQCNAIAKFYIKIAHLFSAIMTTVTSMPNQSQLEKSASGICATRINALKEQMNGDKIILQPKTCEVASNSNQMKQLQGIAELEQLYNVDIYNYQTGEFVGMSSTAKEQYRQDLETFYRAFTGKSSVPSEIKRFGDIKLRDYECRPDKPFEAVVVSKKDKSYLAYAGHLKQMVYNAKRIQYRLMQIINKIFIVSLEKNKVKINPSLTDRLLNGYITRSRNIIVDLYVQCEQDYIKGIKIYKAIIEERKYKSAIEQKKSIEKQAKELIQKQQQGIKKINVSRAETTPAPTQTITPNKLQSVNDDNNTPAISLSSSEQLSNKRKIIENRYLLIITDGCTTDNQLSVLEKNKHRNEYNWIFYFYDMRAKKICDPIFENDEIRNDLVVDDIWFSPELTIKLSLNDVSSTINNTISFVKTDGNGHIVVPSNILSFWSKIDNAMNKDLNNQMQIEDDGFINKNLNNIASKIGYERQLKKLPTKEDKSLGNIHILDNGSELNYDYIIDKNNSELGYQLISSVDANMSNKALVRLQGNLLYIFKINRTQNKKIINEMNRINYIEADPKIRASTIDANQHRFHNIDGKMVPMFHNKENELMQKEQIEDESKASISSTFDKRTNLRENTLNDLRKIIKEIKTKYPKYDESDIINKINEFHSIMDYNGNQINNDLPKNNVNDFIDAVLTQIDANMNAYEADTSGNIVKKSNKQVYIMLPNTGMKKTKSDSSETKEESKGEETKENTEQYGVNLLPPNKSVLGGIYDWF